VSDSKNLTKGSGIEKAGNMPGVSPGVRQKQVKKKDYKSLISLCSLC